MVRALRLEHARSCRHDPLRRASAVEERGAARADRGAPADGGGKSWMHWRKDGSRFDVEVVRRPLRFRGRNARIASMRDVTEHVRASDAPPQSAADYHALVERLPDGVFTYRLDAGDLVYANPALCRLPRLSLERGAHARRHVWSWCTPTTTRSSASASARSRACDPVDAAEPVRFVARDGTIRYAETRGIRVLYDGDAGGDGARARSDRSGARAEEALRLFRGALLQDLPRQPRLHHGHAARPTTPSSTSTSASSRSPASRARSSSGAPAWSSACGRTPSERARSSTTRSAPDGTRARRRGAACSKKSGQPLDAAHVARDLLASAASECVFALSLRHHRAQAARGAAAPGAEDGGDRPARRRRRPRLQQPAHRDPRLRAAARRATLAPEHGGSTTPPRTSSARPLRASSLTEQLLVFTRRQPQQSRACRPQRRRCTSMGALLRRLIGEDIELDARSASRRSARVRVDPAQIEQVLLNLAVNARDAMAARRPADHRDRRQRRPPAARRACG